jgi:hypothetical protein
MASLALQKRLAMALMNCGQRKVWLDPAKKAIIAKARTRTYFITSILIAFDFVYYVWTTLDNTLNCIIIIFLILINCLNDSVDNN